MASFLDIFGAVVPTGLAVLSEIKGPGRNSKRQRIVFGIRLMQILAELRDIGPATLGPANLATRLCYQTINELGLDVRSAILAGYEETKRAAPKLSDDDEDIASAL